MWSPYFRIGSERRVRTSARTLSSSQLSAVWRQVRDRASSYPDLSIHQVTTALRRGAIKSGGSKTSLAQVATHATSQCDGDISNSYPLVASVFCIQANSTQLCCTRAIWLLFAT